MKDKGQRQETEEQRTGKQRNNGQEQRNRDTEKGTLEKLIGIRGRRKEDAL
jgi:hypothetical protein